MTANKRIRSGVGGSPPRLARPQVWLAAVRPGPCCFRWRSYRLEFWPKTGGDRGCLTEGIVPRRAIQL